MKKEQKKSSGFPLALIALVFIVVVIGGIWFYSSSRTGTTNANRAANSGTLPGNSAAVANAPAGAPVGVNMLGNPTAAVTVEEFADYQCGGCAATHPVMKELQAVYAGNRNFRFIYRHYPLSIAGHDKSYDAAVATEAAGLQGKFWQMQDQLFRNQQAWTQNPNFRDIWAGYASAIGLDVDRWKSDMAGIGTKQRVDADMTRGRALNITSTPTVLVNGKPVPFPELNVAALRRIIDAEISTAAASSQPAANSATQSNAPASTANGSK